MGQGLTLLGQSRRAWSPFWRRFTSQPAQQVAAVVFAPDPGAVANGTSVAMTCATPGSVIHYTDDDTPATAASPVYSTAVALPDNDTTTLRAIAVATGYLDSGETTGEYITSAPTKFRFSWAALPSTPADGGLCQITPGGGGSNQVFRCTTAMEDGLPAEGAIASGGITLSTTMDHWFYGGNLDCGGSPYYVSNNIPLSVLWESNGDGTFKVWITKGVSKDSRFFRCLAVTPGTPADSDNGPISVGAIDYYATGGQLLMEYIP